MSETDSMTIYSCRRDGSIRAYTTSAQELWSLNWYLGYKLDYKGWQEYYNGSDQRNAFLVWNLFNANLWTAQLVSGQAYIV